MYAKFWTAVEYSVLREKKIFSFGYCWAKTADVAVHLSDTSVMDGSSSGLPSLKECGVDSIVCKWP